MKSALRIGFFLLLFLLCFSVSQARASENISLSPAYQEVDLAEKEPEKKISFTLSNNTSHSSQFELMPVNFAPNDPNGGLKFFEAKEQSYLFSLASYLQFESTNFVLEAHEKKEIPIIIENRQDLSPGGHYAALIVKQIPGEGETKISPAISALIFLKKIGGERYNLSLKDISFPPSLFTFSYPKDVRVTFQNEGNIHLIPYGRSEVRDMFGRLLYIGVLNENSFFVLPDSRRYIYLTQREVSFSLPISFNTFTFSGTDSLKKVTYSYKNTFIYINPVFASVVLILAICVPIGIRYLKKRKNA